MIPTILGLVIPAAFSFIQDKFGKSKTPEQTLAALAEKNPEAMGQYIQAQASQIEAETKYFNRDVVGTVSPWVADLRAAIRPITVVMGMMIIAGEGFGAYQLPQLTREALLFVISSWFGGRILSKG